MDVDLVRERVVVTTSLPTSQVKELIETTGRKAVVQGLGSAQGKSREVQPPSGKISFQKHTSHYSNFPSLLKIACT